MAGQPISAFKYVRGSSDGGDLHMVATSVVPGG